MNKNIMDIITIDTKFEEIVARYFENMTSDMTLHEVMEENNFHSSFYASNTDLVYTYKCISIFEMHFMEILEIMEDYRIECCDNHPYYEVDALVQIAFDYKINQFLNEVEYYVEYELEDEEEDMTDEDFNKYIVYPTK